MGRIKRFNLRNLMLLSKAEFFFETGTWKGDGLAYASKYGFKKLYSSEIVEPVAVKAIERFKADPRIHIITDSSVNALKTHLEKIDQPCIFWLDAHFPGAEEGLNDYNDFKEESVKLPLQKELEIIAARKQRFNDIIIIDDLRIYEEGNFQNGNLPKTVLPPIIRNTDFAEVLFGDTHKITKRYEDEGYLILLPKHLHQTNPLNKLISKITNYVFKKIL